jgi:hypothetical protein
MDIFIFRKVKRMDKLEYIPGDLISVYVGVKKYIVEVIGTENENEVLLYQIKFPNGEIQYADKDNIVPIPLTPEILEKNGWDFTGYNTNFNGTLLNICSKRDILPYLYYYYATKGFSVSICGKIVLPNIKYIHELQHLLFGLGIKHEMEV